VDWFGPIDFLAMDAHFKATGPPADWPGPIPTVSPETKYLGAPVEQVPDLVRQSDPTTYLSPAMPPLLVQHGSADPQVPVSQSIDFVQAIAERAGPGRCEFDILPGAGHGSPEFETPENVARVFAFLDRRLRS
jgi:dipeptidyl aminopeptidase/acylaminoacyl peptidase